MQHHYQTSGITQQLSILLSSRLYKTDGYSLTRQWGQRYENNCLDGSIYAILGFFGSGI